MRPLLLLGSRRSCRLLLTAFIIFFSCYISNAQASGRGGESTVTFKGKDVPLSDLFKAIKKQTGYTVMYSLSVTQLDGKEKVTVNFNKAGIVEVMAYVLKGRNLVWTIVDESILIYKEDAVKKNIGPPVGVKEKGDTVINMVLPMVMGKVTDADDKPIPGATVMVKGTREGTVTDGEGVFSLANVSVNASLIVKSLGYSPRELVVKGKTIQVKMNVAVSDLDETQIIGYGTTTRRLNTGSVATVTAKDIETHPVMNALTVLQGMIPGLEVKQINGYASAPLKIEIRGRNTINPQFTSEPLYVIDGVPLIVLEVGGLSQYSSGSTGYIQTGFTGPAGGQSPFYSLNPSDIESITVLKDADATAIYGSRGANGVILINTKKGKPGKNRFEVSIYQGVSKVTKYWRMLNTEQYLEIRREAFRNDSIDYGIIPDAGSAPDLVVWDQKHYTNWQKKLWGGVGKTTDAQVGFSGGDSRTTFRLNGGYHRENSILTVSGSDQRGSVSFNLNSKSLNEKFSVSFTSTYSFADNNNIDINSGGSTLPPNAPAIYNSNGRLNYNEWIPVSHLFPFQNLEQPYSSTTENLVSSLGVTYNIKKNLTIQTNFGYSRAQAEQKYLFPLASQDPTTRPTARASYGDNNIKNWIVEPQINYSANIASGKLSILFGASLQESTTRGSAAGGSGFSNDALLQSVSNASVQYASDNYGKYRYAALFGRINYNLEDKYIFNLSARRDGSSRFGDGNQFGNFAALGVAWIFSEERLIKNHLTVLSFGKIRASYGTTGGDGVGDYQYLTQWSGVGSRPYQGAPSLVPLLHANPDYHWQVNRKLEGGIELGFLKDYLNLSISYYRNRCDNQLVQFPTPSFTGFPWVTANSPASVENSGLEFSFMAKIVDSRNFKWSMNFNTGINRNKLLRYHNLERSPYAQTYVIGESLRTRKLLHYIGVDPQTGLYSFVDKNKDGKINIYGANETTDLFNYDLAPAFSGGFGSNFTYRGWQLSLFFNVVKQRGINGLSAASYAGTMYNQPVEVLDRWRKPGDIAKFARMTTQPTDSYANFYGYSDGAYTDASYVRLRNVSLSYAISEKLISRSGLKGGTIFFRGENILVITKYKGLDPETQNFGGMPPQKVFVGGIQFSL